MTRQITINISEITETFDVYSLAAAEKAKIIKAQADALKKADAKITRLRAENEKLRAALDDAAVELEFAHFASMNKRYKKAAKTARKAAALKETGD